MNHAALKTQSFFQQRITGCLSALTLMQRLAPNLLAAAGNGGLSLAGPIKAAGSDASGQRFQAVLPSMAQFIKAYLPEAHNNLGSPLAFSIDRTNLTLSTASDVRTDFAYEGAGNRNTFGSTRKTAATAGRLPDHLSRCLQQRWFRRHWYRRPHGFRSPAPRRFR